MSNSMKSFLFCLVGFVVFQITGTILSPVILVATAFLLGAFISISVYVFKKIKTKHTFLKSTLCSIIGMIILVSNNTILNLMSKSMDTESNFYLLSKTICIYGTIFLAFITAVSLIVYVFDILMSLFMKFPADRNVMSIKVFKFCLFGVLTFCLVGLIFSMFNLLAILFHVISLVCGIAVIFLNTKVKVPFKMTASSISGFVSCVVMFYYFYYVADLSFQSYLGNSLSILNVYNYACGLFLFAIFISSMVLIIRDIFSKLSGVSGSLIALVISVVGTAISYVLWSFGGVLPFLSSLPMTVSIFWVMFILFILGIAVSIMSIAFKLIFKDTKTEKIEQIDIDVDEDNFVNVNKEDSK